MAGVDAYVVRAVPYARGWVLYISGPGVPSGITESHTLRGAEVMARDYVAAVLGLCDGAGLRVVLVARNRQPWWRELLNALRR